MEAPSEQTERRASEQELDLLHWSKKKVRKEGEGFSEMVTRVPREEPWMVDEEPRGETRTWKGVRSFAETVKKGPQSNWMEEEEENPMLEETEIEDSSEEEVDFEKDLEQKDAPEGEFSPSEDVIVTKVEEGLYNLRINETTIRKLWKLWWNSLIVKLVGRKIGYSVMKRLENMWSGKGSIDVIDLGHDFYLVKFYSQEDLDYALLEGPWKIYDHYLAVR
ncbi:hypothetical protein AHAS_Ahas07G0100100 [Arachis hypogaea]